MYKLHAAAFAQCILLPTLQNVGTKLLVTLPLLQNLCFWYYSTAKGLLNTSFTGNFDIKRVILQ